MKWFLLLAVLKTTFSLAVEVDPTTLSELRKIKPEFAKAKIDSQVLPSGAAVAVISSTEGVPKLSAYLKIKSTATWKKITEEIDPEYGTEMRLNPQGQVLYKTESAGTAAQETVTKWAFESEELRIVGLDSKATDKTVVAHGSIDEPFVRNESINFLTGDIEVSAQFTNNKKMKNKCKIENPSLEYYRKKLFPYRDIGIELPNCPWNPGEPMQPSPIFKNSIEGVWKFKGYGCATGKLTARGEEENELLRNGTHQARTTIDKNKAVTEFRIQMKTKDEDYFSVCLMRTTEEWIYDLEKISMKAGGTNEALGVGKMTGPCFEAVATEKRTEDRERAYDIIGTTMRVYLMGQKSPIKVCDGPHDYLLYEKLN